MVQKPKSILRDKAFPTSMDYAELKREGIENIQKLSGKIWTDFNAHDPGVTILENLCFALTELGFKTNFSIEDIFFHENGQGKDFLQTFFQAYEILPCAPTTINDFRKILIDKIPDLKNAWLTPIKQSSLGTKIEGLYEVLLLTRENSKEADIVSEVRKLLSANRNLCEDFDRIRMLDSEPIRIQLTLNISPDSIGESIVAQILMRLSEHFAPTIPHYNIEELLEKGYSYEDIFSMPLMENGFILDEDLENSNLSNLNKVFRSELIKIINDIEGVNEVLEFNLLMNGVETTKELIQFDAYKIPELDIETIVKERDISLYAGDILYNVDNDVVGYTLDSMKSTELQSHRRYMDLEITEINSNRERSEIEKYISIQNSFPKTYGITEYGIDGNPTDNRKAKVKQLQAYLYFFEQLMANHLSQLVNLNRLLTADKDVSSTYFSQPINHINNFDKITGEDNQAFNEHLEALISKYDNAEVRRNRFLDHLLARYGEELLSDAYNAIHRESSDYAKIDFTAQSILAKQRYLKNYIELSRNRLNAFDYLLGIENNENVSALQKKISLLFNINDFGYKNLSQISENKNLKQNQLKSKPANSALNNQEFKFSSKNKNILAEILGFGVERNHFLVEADKKEFLVYFEHPHDKTKEPVFKGKTVNECDKAITKLIDTLNELNKQSEGFHVLEHILLRDINAKYAFSFVSDTNNIFRTPYEYDDPLSDKPGFIENLIKLGSVKKNYSVESLKDKSFQIVLKDKDKVIAYDDSFVIKKSAEDSINDYVKEISKLKPKDPNLDFTIQFEQDTTLIKTYDEDPFSMQLSFILPAWSGRLNNKRVKYLFEQITKLNAPAYLKINFLWLDIEEMKTFESTFERWLKEKASAEPKQPLLDNLSAYLLFFILKHIAPEERKAELETEFQSVKKRL
jgi:hypothetical protein